jgi:hypothetical protein
LYNEQGYLAPENAFSVNFHFQESAIGALISPGSAQESDSRLNFSDDLGWPLNQGAFGTYVERSSAMLVSTGVALLWFTKKNCLGQNLGWECRSVGAQCSHCSIV